MEGMFRMAAAALGLALAAAGCELEVEDGADAGEEIADLAAPTVTIDNVTAYQGVAGALAVEVTAGDDVGVALVELLVDGVVAASSDSAPFALSWDTTAAADGVVAIAARASDASGKAGESAPIAVVVINGGAEAAITDGATGALSIPAGYDGTQEVDVRRHWIGETAAARVVAIVIFAPEEGQAEWTVGLDMGSGFCPDDGVTLDSMIVYGATAEPVVWDSTPETGFPASTQLFFHMAPGNPAEHLGESLPFSLRVFYFE